MKKNKKHILLALCMLSMFLISRTSVAQCSDISMSLVVTESTCFANGTIKIIVEGNDLVNIDQETMQFRITGDRDMPFAQYTNNTIVDLPAGTYNISLRAFCNVDGDWAITSNAATATITSSYTPPTGTLNVVGRRHNLACWPEAIGEITLRGNANTGVLPYTIVMTQKPAEYTGETTFIVNNLNDYRIENLPAGNYAFSHSDACGYTIDGLTATVDIQAVESITNIFTLQFQAPPFELGTCDLVRIRYNAAPNTVTGHIFHIDSVNKYFEFAFLINNEGTKNWQAIEQFTDISISPHTYKTAKETSLYVTPYMRVKGSTCERRLSNITFNSGYNQISISAAASLCAFSEISFIVSHNYMLCYPYRWRLLVNDSVYEDWSEPQNEPDKRFTITNPPTGAVTLEVIDSDGYVFTTQRTLSPQRASISASTQTTNNSVPHPVSGYYPARVYLTFSSFPVGTIIEYISGPTVPSQTTLITDRVSAQIYPYNSNRWWQEGYTYLHPGTYRFRVSIPGCDPYEVQTNLYQYKYNSSPSHTLEYDNCGNGLLYPSGGSYESHSPNGAITQYNDDNNNIFYGIISAPYSPFDNRKVKKGEALILEQSGRYIIGISQSTSGIPSNMLTDTIIYTAPPGLALDNTVTSAYLCRGESVGYMRLGAMHGSGNYEYELYDNGVLISTNTTGIFSYGTAGSTYQVRLHDIDCQTSYTQNITIADLNTTQIAYSTTANVCLSDSIYLNCITLGETTYLWSGPGIDATNEHLQNPVIYAGDIGSGTHTYTVKVTPENCGEEMQQSLTIAVAESDPGIIGSDTTVCLNTPINPFVSIAPANGRGTIIYLWEQSADSSVWVSASGTNDQETYSPPPLTADVIYYRRRVTDDCSVSYSNVVTITRLLIPDVYPAASTSSATAADNAVAVTINVVNQGDVAIASPAHVTLYKNSVSAANKIVSESGNITINPGDTGTVVINIPDIMLHMPFSDIIVRVNDDGTTFPVHAECDTTNNVIAILNPSIGLLMEKDAELLSIANRGTYPNPVSVLGNEEITYSIKVVNPTDAPAKIIIADTLPAYLKYVGGSSIPTASTSPTSIPEQSVLRWEFPAVSSMGSENVSFRAMPVDGASASQPLFINHAMVSIIRSTGDSIHVRSNGTYHQGAGISIMTFSASLGGEIFNATEQALDYMSTPNAGIIIAPEEGYRFGGWSHDGYTSLRGVSIRAQRGIMHYDTLTVYGNVELHAEFVPVEMLLKDEQEEAVSEMPEEDKVWTVKGELFVTTTHAGSIVRVYTTEGTLREQHTIVPAGTTSRKLPRGLYVVTINNGIGHKIRIE